MTRRISTFLRWIRVHFLGSLSSAENRKRFGVRIGVANNGLGVFATKDVPADDVIGTIHGRPIDDMNYGSDYCIELDDTRSLEPQPPFRFLNHSCEPNCRLFVCDDLEIESDIVILEAIRQIETGTELTIDYGWPVDSSIPCECGSGRCRGRIMAID